MFALLRVQVAAPLCDKALQYVNLISFQQQIARPSQEEKVEEKVEEEKAEKAEKKEEEKKDEEEKDEKEESK